MSVALIRYYNEKRRDRVEIDQKTEEKIKEVLSQDISNSEKAKKLIEFICKEYPRLCPPLYGKGIRVWRIDLEDRKIYIYDEVELRYYEGASYYKPLYKIFVNKVRKGE